MNENRIKKVMSKVFNINENSIGTSSSQDTIENWDSLKHMQLIYELEEEFKVEFTTEEIVDILSYPLIKIMLESHGISFN